MRKSVTQSHQEDVLGGVGQVSACLVGGLETKPFSGARVLRTPPPSRRGSGRGRAISCSDRCPQSPTKRGVFPLRANPFLRSCRDTEVPGEAGLWGAKGEGLRENKTVLWTDTLPFLIWHLLWSLTRQIYYNRKPGAVCWFSNLLLHQRAFPGEGNPTCRPRGKCRAGRIAALAAGALCPPLPLRRPPWPPSPAAGTQAAARTPPAPRHVCPPPPPREWQHLRVPRLYLNPNPRPSPTNDRAAWIRSQRTTERASEGRCPKAGGTALPNESTFLSRCLPAGRCSVCEKSQVVARAFARVLTPPTGPSRLTPDTDPVPIPMPPARAAAAGTRGRRLPTCFPGDTPVGKGSQHMALMVGFFFPLKIHMNVSSS